MATDEVKILDTETMESVSSGVKTGPAAIGTDEKRTNKMKPRMTYYYCYRCGQYKTIPSGYQHWDGNCPICRQPMRRTSHRPE